MPLESPDWYEAERQPDQIARRRVQLKRKIARLSLPHDHLLQGPTLDVACGCGEALDLFHMRGHRRLVGLDLHDQPLDGFPGRYAYLRASAAALPFPDSSLQLVCCFHALHHLADEAEIGRFLLEAERILRPGGYLALIDFHAGFALRLAVQLVLAGLTPPTSQMRHMRGQLIQERASMASYFSSFRSIERRIRGAPLRRIHYGKGLVFFYYLGKKES